MVLLSSFLPGPHRLAHTAMVSALTTIALLYVIPTYPRSAPVKHAKIAPMGSHTNHFPTYPKDICRGNAQICLLKSQAGAHGCTATVSQMSAPVKNTYLDALKRNVHMVDGSVTGIMDVTMPDIGTSPLCSSGMVANYVAKTCPDPGPVKNVLTANFPTTTPPLIISQLNTETVSHETIMEYSRLPTIGLVINVINASSTPAQGLGVFGESFTDSAQKGFAINVMMTDCLGELPSLMTSQLHAETITHETNIVNSHLPPVGLVINVSSTSAQRPGVIGEPFTGSSQNVFATNVLSTCCLMKLPQ